MKISNSQVQSSSSSNSSDEIVDRLRVAYGVATDVELSRALKLDKSTISGWRKRDSPRPLEFCKLAAERFGWSMDWLVFGVGERRRGDAPPRSRADEVLDGMRREAEYVVAQMEREDAERAARTERSLEERAQWHWDFTRRSCAEDADFPQLLELLAWLLSWWEAVGPEDHAWLMGQLARHIPDWAQRHERPSLEPEGQPPPRPPPDSEPPAGDPGEGSPA